MSTYLLIHGAWHGSWSWRKVVPLLKAKGHTILTPDLPGHGDDTTDKTTVTLQSYTDLICQIIYAQPEPVIVVGHSMGGIAITQAAERCQDRIAALVYLCAFLPRNGESLLTWSLQDQESMVNPLSIDLRADGSMSFKADCSREAFYGSCTDEDAISAQAQLSVEPSAPFATPVETSMRCWGQIPRYYIECQRDHAITLKLQREMQKYSPCQQTFSIDTDHSPFFSAPEQLAEILAQIAKV